MLSEYMKMHRMEYLEIIDAQRARLINNHKNRNDKHGADME